MADFKIVIADPKEGKTFQKEVKGEQGDIFVGKNIDEKIPGDSIDLPGYEFQITGGSDNCGFPMRHGILGIRKKITLYGGTGYKGGLPGERKRKTVCGHKVNDAITQINLKVVKQGEKKLSEIFQKKEEEKPAA
ncbi:30S ribosomal protein S6e [Nanoarchaeota archaeon]